ncbi:MAG TPA: superoxide dismutase [Gemmataceae bacterium]|nr:superoxide dismutase [Gemmataceae bacterium]
MLTMTRRDLLHTAAAGAAAVTLSPLAAWAAEEKKAGFTLPKLPYDYDALEPHIDAETMKIHHDLHHKAYVDNLNKALAGQSELLAKPVEEILRDINSVPKNIRQAVINHGGGHANHTMFWEIMGKDGGKPGGELAKAIDDAFGSVDKFQEQVSQAAITRFGSGWGWLVVDKGKLKILSTANQDSPLMKGQTPILGIDVWEHAYYLKYRNRRPEYVKNWWNVVNWEAVAARYDKAPKQG